MTIGRRARFGRWTVAAAACVLFGAVTPAVGGPDHVVDPERSGRNWRRRVCPRVPLLCKTRGQQLCEAVAAGMRPGSTLLCGREERRQAIRQRVGSRPTLQELRHALDQGDLAIAKPVYLSKAVWNMNPALRLAVAINDIAYDDLKRKGGDPPPPHSVHPETVAYVLTQELGRAPHLCQALVLAYLHDVIEDNVHRMVVAGPDAHPSLVIVDPDAVPRDLPPDGKLIWATARAGAALDEAFGRFTIAGAGAPYDSGRIGVGAAVIHATDPWMPRDLRPYEGLPEDPKLCERIVHSSHFAPWIVRGGPAVVDMKKADMLTNLERRHKLESGRNAKALCDEVTESLARRWFMANALHKSTTMGSGLKPTFDDALTFVANWPEMVAALGSDRWSHLRAMRDRIAEFAETNAEAIDQHLDSYDAALRRAVAP